MRCVLLLIISRLTTVCGDHLIRFILLSKINGHKQIRLRYIKNNHNYYYDVLMVFKRLQLITKLSLFVHTGINITTTADDILVLDTILICGSAVSSDCWLFAHDSK